MAIRNVIPKTPKQRGASLIEFMVASLVGVIALGIAGSIFVSGYKIATKSSKELLLLQNMSSAVQQIKEDMHRAGFSGLSSSSSTLSGASYSIYTQTSPDMVGFVYRVASSGANAFRNVVYRHQPQITGADLLKICEKHQPNPLAPTSAANSGFAGSCYNVFDPKQITVNRFTAVTNSTHSTKVSSAFATISIAASLLDDPSIHHTMVIQLQQRNWQ